MKIVSNQVEHINLNEGSCNLLYFQNSFKEYELRQQFRKWLTNKLLEEDLFYVLKNDRELTVRDFEVLELHGGNINNIPQKLLQQWLKYKIQNEDFSFEQLQVLQNYYEQFCFDMNFEIGGFEIELLPPESFLESILKVCSIDITNKQQESSLSIAKLTVELWKETIFNNKPKLVIYYYPENDNGTQTIKVFLDEMANQGITVICFTKNEPLLKMFSFEKVFLIKSNGTFYNVSELYKQLELFYGENELTEVQIVELALRDFTNEFGLLNEKYKQFLLSSRF